MARVDRRSPALWGIQHPVGSRIQLRERHARHRPVTRFASVPGCCWRRS